MTKRKKLYKVFKIDGDGNLEGPYAGVKYWKEVDQYEQKPITAKTAPGWLSPKETGIRLCAHGWHAVGLEQLDRYFYNWSPSACFEVELRNCHYDAFEKKWVGEQMKIIRRYSREEFRGWKRDQKRARRS